MPHTPEEHFKMIVGLQLADCAAQLATARATIEALTEDIAAYQAQLAAPAAPTTKKTRPRATKDPTP